MDPTHRYEYLLSWSLSLRRWTVAVLLEDHEEMLVMSAHGDTPEAAVSAAFDAVEETAQDALAKALESARRREKVTL